MLNDLNQRSREVAELVEDWEKLFNAFNVPCKTQNGALYAKCPKCRSSVWIQLDSNRGYPTWRCGECGAERKLFDSYLGLISAYNHGVARGELLGEIEHWALGQLHSKPLPAHTLDFGRHKGKDISEVPRNYLLWAIRNDCRIPEDVVEQVRESFGSSAPVEEDAAEVIF